MRAALRTVLLPAMDPDAQAWRRAVIAAGGAVSPARLRLVNQLISSLKACGAWALTDDYAIWAAESSTQALVTLKRRLTQVVGNSPVFTADRGFKGDASSAYINTGWNYAQGTQYTQNNARYGFWSETGPTTTGGHSMGTNNLYASWIFGSTTVSFGINGSTSMGGYETFAHGGNKTGLFVAERTGATTDAGYRNTVQQVAGTRGSFVPESLNAFALAATANGSTAVGCSDGRISALLYGKSLSPAQAAAEYSALRSFMTAVGVA